MKIICVLVAFFTGSLLVCSIKNVCMGRECAAHVRATQAIEENMSLFGRSMAPGHLDKVLEELEGLDDRDGQGNAAPEIRRYKLQTYFRLFRMITESVDASYLPRMYRILTGKGGKKLPEKVPRPIPAKVGSAYLYDYIQSGLRVLRFQTRVAVMDYIRSAYSGKPSPEERKELLALAEGVEKEFFTFLQNWTQTDVSWMPDKDFNCLDKPALEEKLREMISCLQYMHFLEYARDPLFLEEDVAFSNIDPPPPVGKDGMAFSGQAPDSLHEPESRRQYLIARRENIRKSRGADLKKKVHDKLTDAYWNVFTRIESVEFMDQASRRALLHTAEMLGMNDDFRDNLRDVCARKDIDEAIDRFSQTKDRKDMQAADALIGAFQQCRKVLWGNESSTFFQLKRWLRLNHIVATETSWPDGSLVTQDLEEKMMENIRCTCGDSRFYLQEARWWLAAYGLKARASYIHDECQRILEMEKKRIEDSLLLLDENFSRGGLEKADRLIESLLHHDYQRHKNILEILDFKTASWLRLLFILEKRLDPSHERREEVNLVFKIPEEGRKEEYDEGAQELLYGLHAEIFSDLSYKVESEYEKSRETQQNFLKLAEGMGAEPEFLMYFKHRFDGRNLREDLDQLREKGKGSPERIAAAIDEWVEHEKIYCSSPYGCLVEKLGLQFSLLKAMHKSGNSGKEGFGSSFQAAVMEAVSTSLADNQEGFLAWRYILERSEGCPLETAIATLFQQRLDKKEELFHEKLVTFEEEGQMDDLHTACVSLDDITRDWELGKELPVNRRRKTETYLNLLRVASRFRPQELVDMQRKPVSQWGGRWNNELPPLRRMELELDLIRDRVRTDFFSHIRYGYGKGPEDAEEIRQLLRNAGMSGQFMQEVEERLAEKE